MDTHYIGEHLLPGQLGHLAVIIAFISSLLATISYVTASVRQKRQLPDPDSWKRLGRIAFIIQVAAVFSIFGLLVWIISQHYFEYYYVWEHTSRDLAPKFLLASIWEGQEGSFLLWAIWHCVLGLVLIRFAKEWESPVMSVISFAQFCIASMLLGIYFWGYRVGSNPFILLRNAGVMPFEPGPDYLSMIRDGAGLNALLQNYWMVIHPPVLFLGFASTLVPFAYAVAGLWMRKYNEWVKPALPWGVFAAMVLGTGIMLGGAWAYESLTFGGYWAWDPVENASLVPWLTLVAGIHTLLVYKHTGHSLRASFFFFIISFILVLYSTFLTRSGILGDSSVHAFTDLGMSGQLLVYLFVFLVPAFVLFAYRYKEIPAPRTEEPLHTREFWMFIGSLLLFISAVFISFTTSIPVWNKIFHTNMAEPVDREFHYNRIQIFIAILIALGTAVVQYYKYRQNSWQFLRKKIAVPTVIAGVACMLFGWLSDIHYNRYGLGFLIAIYLLFFVSIYAVVANLGYILIMLKGRLRKAGASVAHAGFALFLIGVVLSSAKKQVISIDRMGMMDVFDFSNKNENPRENVFLPFGVPVQMGDYEVTYAGDSTAPGDPKIYYAVQFADRQHPDKPLFTLYPDILKNTKGMQGYSANPHTEHFWNKDIFTYVNYASNIEPDQSDTARYYTHEMKTGDTVFLQNGYLVLKSLYRNPQNPNYHPEPQDVAVAAELDIFSGGKTYTASPIYYLRGNEQGAVDDTVQPLQLYLHFGGIDPAAKKIMLAVKQIPPRDHFIVLKAYVFPFINIVWLGVVVTILGFLISLVHRIRQQFEKVKNAQKTVYATKDVEV
ncbi:MAG: cytochrome c biogenesis protein CcsA [Thermoflavifilum aggregans]|nr:cytochrome c biogenesis protein CcsA [Thermoflavifilum aggregans]